MRPQQLQRQLQERVEPQPQRLAQLETQADLLGQIVNASPATVYRCAIVPPYSCPCISPTIETVLGYTPEEFTAEPDFWGQRIHPDDAPRVFANVSALFEQGRLKWPTEM